MLCPGLSIHKYYEEEDVVRCHPLNPELIEFVAEQGWVILEKLAEGSVADVFICKQNRIRAVLVLLANVDLESNGTAYDIDHKIKAARKFPNIFPIVYDTFKADIPYSTDELYLQNSEDFEYRTIQVLEELDMTLEEYVKTVPSQELPSFIEVVRRTLTHYLEVLEENSIYYSDLKPDNVGVVVTDVVYLKLLDIQGIHLTRVHEYDISYFVHHLLTEL